MGTKASITVAFLVLLGVACGSPSTPAAATSPTPDAATQFYVALVKGYWDQIQAADNATATTNEAARACLGTVSSNAPQDANLVEPAICHTRAVAILAVHEKFMKDLKGAIAPERYAEDDRVFRSSVPQAIIAIRTLVSVSTTSNKQAVLSAANAYVDTMLSSVVLAIDDVDPSTPHY